MSFIFASINIYLTDFWVHYSCLLSFAVHYFPIMICFRYYQLQNILWFIIQFFKYLLEFSICFYILFSFCCIFLAYSL
jgi:hypothetical protein